MDNGVSFLRHYWNWGQKVLGSWCWRVGFGENPCREHRQYHGDHEEQSVTCYPSVPHNMPPRKQNCEARPSGTGLKGRVTSRSTPRYPVQSWSYTIDRQKCSALCRNYGRSWAETNSGKSIRTPKMARRLSDC